MGLTIGLLEKAFPKSYLALKTFHARIEAIEEIPPATRAALRQESYVVVMTLADEMYEIKEKVTAISPVAAMLAEALRKRRK